MGISDQQRLKRIDEKLGQLKKAVTDWRLYDGYDPKHPASEIWELEENRKHLAARIAKRGSVRGRARSDDNRGEAPSDPASAGDPTHQRGGFTHSDDYRSVTLRGVRISLTSKQAQVIQILHKAYESGNPEVGNATVLEKLETGSSRLRDTFRSNPKAWAVLVRQGGTKGSYRLNI
jgi:hypothetical protein